MKLSEEEFYKSKIMHVSLNKSYPRRNYKTELSLYEISKAFWPANIQEAETSDYVASVYKGKIMAVYKPTVWRILWHEHEDEKLLNKFVENKIVTPYDMTEKFIFRIVFDGYELECDVVGKYCGFCFHKYSSVVFGQNKHFNQHKWNNPESNLYAKALEPKIYSLYNFEIGDTIKILDGPFATFTGTVKAIIKEKTMLIVEVEIFGRPTPVELSFSQVEKL